MTLIGLLVLVLFVCVICWAVYALVGAFQIQEPIRTVIFVVVAIAVLFFLLSAVGLWPANIRIFK